MSTAVLSESRRRFFRLVNPIAASVAGGPLSSRKDRFEEGIAEALSKVSEDTTWKLRDDFYLLRGVLMDSADMLDFYVGHFMLPSDDNFRDYCSWVLSLGSKAYSVALKTPPGLVAFDDEDDEEDYHNVFMRVLPHPAGGFVI